jgi:carboxyl-terminal processing protease
VVGAIAGGPAAIAGMQDGDRIEAVDGVSVLPLDLDAILDLLRGEPGSTALVKVERNGQPIELHVQRDVLTFLSARTRRLSDDVLYVRISRFQEGATANQLVSGLLRELADAPGLPKLWVMDLRANHGDSLEEVAAVASLFVPQGQTVLRLSSRAEGLRPVLATAGGSSDHPAAGLVADLMRSIPAVVLVDERTANGAEALARILRERLQARIAGSPTANIDNVMKEFNLRSEASMRITVGRILSAAGQRWGPGGVPIDLPLANTPDAKFGDMSRDGLLAGAVERYAR